MKKVINAIYVMHGCSIYQGSNRSLLSMIDGLVLKGVNPIVIMPKYESENLCLELSNRKVPYVILNYFMPVYPAKKTVRDIALYLPRLLKTLFLNYIAVKKIGRIARENKTDLIHTNVGPLLVGYKCAKELNLPHVWHVREYQDLDFNMNTFYSKETFNKMLHEEINHPIAISKGIYDYFGLNNSSRMIYNGIFKIAETRFSTEKLKVFLYVGRLTENKGAGAMIRAFIEFAKTDAEYKLLLAGAAMEAEYLEQIETDVKFNKLEERIHFLGVRNDVRDLMLHANALIVPSVSEAFGRITAEAMFNGCLVIGNNAGGTKEILGEEQLGILYSGHDELVEAMQSVVNNGIEYYYPTIKKAQQRAALLFSQEGNAIEVFKYYTEILNLNR